MIWKMADTLTEYKILGRSNIQMVRAREGSISCHLTKFNRRTVNGSFSFFFFFIGHRHQSEGVRLPLNLGCGPLHR